MDFQKKQMHEAAILYYEKKHTQNEIAKIMNLSRQTVSKLLNEAIKEGIVEIKIKNPEIVCSNLERDLCDKFKIKNAVVCGVSNDNDSLCMLMTVQKAADYLRSVIEKGNQKIAISWGRTIEMLISKFGDVVGTGNIVFPLFGATDREESYFLSNELARSFADKIGAAIKYAWFPYLADSVEDCKLFKKTSYYKTLYELWNDIDIAVLGIGNSDIIRAFGQVFGYSEKCNTAVGDISTHFFNSDGEFIDIYENTLCATKENLKNARQTIAVASGKSKTEAIIGALRTDIIDTLITDEYTAERILYFEQKDDSRRYDISK